MSHTTDPLRRLRMTAARVAAPVVLAGTLLVAAQVAWAVAPQNQVPPQITGTPTEGQTLTASNGTWDDPLATFTHAWLSCDGANCTAISGANATSYVLRSADVGKTIKAAVTAKNALDESSAPAESAPTETIAAAPPVAPANTAPPEITGDAVEGEALSASNGSWTGTAPITFTREWLRCTGDRKRHV